MPVLGGSVLGTFPYVCVDATACGRKCVRVCGHESGHVFSGSRMCLRCVCVHAWIYAYMIYHIGLSFVIVTMDAWNQYY